LTEIAVNGGERGVGALPGVGIMGNEGGGGVVVRSADENDRGSIGGVEDKLSREYPLVGVEHIFEWGQQRGGGIPLHLNLPGCKYGYCFLYDVKRAVPFVT
jgi:hypothetical protein